MNPYLMPTIEFGPLTVRRLVELIPAHRRDERLIPERFTPREIIAHLADWEPILLQRMKTAYETPGTTIEVYDEEEMARLNRYDLKDPLEQAELFIKHRCVTADFLRNLQPDDWKKTVWHPERGVLSIEDQANLLIGHDLYHIEQLSAYLGNRSDCERNLV
jgi:hypothetical protein